MVNKNVENKIKVLGKDYIDLGIDGGKSIFVFGSISKDKYRGKYCILNALSDKKDEIYRYEIENKIVKIENTRAKVIRYYDDKRIILFCSDDSVFKGFYIKEYGYRFISEEKLYSVIGYKDDCIRAYLFYGAVYFYISKGGVKIAEYIITNGGKIYKVNIDKVHIRSNSDEEGVLDVYNKDGYITHEVKILINDSGYIEVDSLNLIEGIDYELVDIDEPDLTIYLEYIGEII